uniref:Uncharacterized protein n=1 Tax=viral metagenome TaxID=1070528 RepID=A0A6C0AES7_9ZZZZ
MINYKYAKYFYKYYRKSYLILIEKQIKKIKNFNEEFFLDCLYKSYLKNSEDIKKDKSSHILLVISNCINMDIYFLLRFLKTHDSNDKDICNKNSLYSIFYGGSTHSKLYELFFKMYYKVEPLININNQNKGFIDLENTFDFFENY